MKSAWVSATLSGVIFNLNGILLKSGFETQECFLNSSCEERIHSRGEKKFKALDGLMDRLLKDGPSSYFQF